MMMKKMKMLMISNNNNKNNSVATVTTTISALLVLLVLVSSSQYNVADGAATQQCIQCDDETVAGWMRRKNKACDDIDLDSRCNKNNGWRKKKYCQLGCYNIGLGYEGDECCNGINDDEYEYNFYEEFEYEEDFYEEEDEAAVEVGPGLQEEERCIGKENVPTFNLNFFDSTVTENALHTGGTLRYENIGTANDRIVDFEVSLVPGTTYSTTRPERNGLESTGKFGNINVMELKNDDIIDGEGNFEFCFRDHSTNELIEIELFHFSLFDVDERSEADNGIKEKVVMDTSQIIDYILYPTPTDSEIKVSCEDGSTDLPCPNGIKTIFHSSTKGVGDDNPTDPENMTETQKERSIVFTFKNTSCFTMTYFHYCPVDDCSWYGGGNFLFSGDASQVINGGECIVQPPTITTLSLPNDEEEESTFLCEGKEEVLTKLDFYEATLTENTLHYPDQSGRLRYEGVGLFQGDPIDLVVTQNLDSPPYSTDMSIRNGYNYGDDPENPDTRWERFGNINIMTKDPRDDSISDENKALMNGEATFDFCFYHTGTEDKATVDSFDWSVYDLDFRGGGLNEKLTFDTSQAEFYRVQGDTEVKMWCENEGPASAIKSGTFNYQNEEGETITVDRYKPVTCDPGVKTIFHSTSKGRVEDNPTDPEKLTKQQLSRSIEFRFANTSCWTFKYEHYCPCDNYCKEDGGSPSNSCSENQWCPQSSSDHKNYDNKYPYACKSYTGGNFLFAGTADEKITEEGECVTPSPTPAPDPTTTPTSNPSSTPTGTPTLAPSLKPTTLPPTNAPTNLPTVIPTVPTATPVQTTDEPTRSPIAETITLPTVSRPPRECIDDIIVKKILGETEFPISPIKPVSIVDGDGDTTVTVSLRQSWTDATSTVDRIFASYKETLFDPVCVEATNVIGGGAIFDSITIRCNVMSPRAHLKICVVDDLINEVLTPNDDAEVPKCCHPEIPPNHGTVCYEVEINCNSKCIEESQYRRQRRSLLRAGNL